MDKVIRASLGYIGRSLPWLAEQLGLSWSGIYKKMKEESWTLPELRRMREIFRWKTLEG